MNPLLICVVLVARAVCAPAEDRVPSPPGFSPSFTSALYSGYLSLTKDTREGHYVFVESKKGASNSDPVTLWLNGGPGCSSLLGFMQEIGPYYLEDGQDYKLGDSLIQNPYSWHNISNLLFLESPAGVGFSYNLEKKYINNDTNTAEDNMNALISFFKKFPEYKQNPFWIAGQSYAGKYIPDLSVLIDKYNTPNKMINFKGILVGNGVMSFSLLQYNTIDFLIKKGFIQPQLVGSYRHTCGLNPDSTTCRSLVNRIMVETEELNPYNVFGYCYYNDSFSSVSSSSQESILKSIKRDKFIADVFRVLPKKSTLKQEPKLNGAPCAYFDGMYNYFNLNARAYHAKFADQTWNGPCAQNITYDISVLGSIASYRTLLSSGNNYQIVLYNGDWDSVVPYTDTLAGLAELQQKEASPYVAWFTDDQHSGFQQRYDGLTFVTVKGASHQVPQSKRKQSFALFNSIISGNKGESLQNIATQ